MEDSTDHGLNGGGIIPEEDVKFLKEKGVLDIFTPGTSLDYITKRVAEMV